MAPDDRCSVAVVVFGHGIYAGRHRGDWGTFGGEFGRLFMLNAQEEIREIRVGIPADRLPFHLLGMGRDATGEVYLCGRSNLGPSGSTGVVAKLIPPVGIDSIERSAGPALRLQLLHDATLTAGDVTIERASTGPDTGADWSPQSATVISNGVQMLQATFPEPAGSRGYFRARRVPQTP